MTRITDNTQEAGRAALSEASSRPAPLYLLVEKILEPLERLPSAWPVHGTTGTAPSISLSLSLSLSCQLLPVHAYCTACLYYCDRIFISVWLSFVCAFVEVLDSCAPLTIFCRIRVHELDQRRIRQHRE
jgi:hypothetical protein